MFVFLGVLFPDSREGGGVWLVLFFADFEISGVVGNFEVLDRRDSRAEGVVEGE